MKKLLFCVDSDGTVMDTMTYKHQLFFGPIAAKYYNITGRDVEKYQEIWDRLNLFSITRGINRFEGLAAWLDEIKYDKFDYSNFKIWVENTESLSNDSLASEIEKKNTEDLRIALSWSKEVNKRLQEAKDLDFPFDGALDTLKMLKAVGEVFIVSSANKEAVLAEWTKHGLMGYVDDVYCQDKGVKKDVIAEFIAKGRDPNSIIMIGDSVPDKVAAMDNSIKFYPILVGHELESWTKLQKEVLDLIVSDQFSRAYQLELIESFLENLK